MTHKYQKKAFTLIELLIAIFLISISILVLFKLKISNSNFVTLNKNELIAYNLAEQGKEMIKGYTNTKGIDFMKTNYITSEDNYVEVGTNPTNIELIKKNTSEEKIHINQKGLNASNNDILVFTRSMKLEKNPLDENSLLLEIEVDWSDQAGIHNKIIEEILH